MKVLPHRDLPSHDIINKIKNIRITENNHKHYPNYSEVVGVFKSICRDNPNLLIKQHQVDTTISLKIEPIYSALLKFMFGVYYEELTSKDIQFLGTYLESLGSGVRSHNFFNIYSFRRNSQQITVLSNT